MKTIELLFILTILSLCYLPPVAAESHAQPIKKFCLQGGESIPFFQAVNRGSQRSVMATSRMMKQKELITGDAEDLSTLFIQSTLSENDCFIGNINEAMKLQIRTPQTFVEDVLEGIGSLLTDSEKTPFVPVVVFRKEQHREYGFVYLSDLESFSEVPYTPVILTRDLLRYKTGKDLTVIYIICTPDRNRTCELSIKHNNRWVHESVAKKFTLRVLARSRRENFDKDLSLRLHSDGDTAQGVYTLWASMFSKNPVFGGVPRIDIDASYTPVGSGSHLPDSYLLSHLVPLKSVSDYWFNELPLSYYLGRTLIRIHGDSIDPDSPPAHIPPDTKTPIQGTQGCINAGEHTLKLFKVLSKLGIFEESTTENYERDHPFWKAAPGLGRAFVIVKDK